MAKWKERKECQFKRRRRNLLQVKSNKSYSIKVGEKKSIDCTRSCNKDYTIDSRLKLMPKTRDFNSNNNYLQMKRIGGKSSRCPTTTTTTSFMSLPNIYKAIVLIFVVVLLTMRTTANQLGRIDSIVSNLSSIKLAESENKVSRGDDKQFNYNGPYKANTPVIVMTTREKTRSSTRDFIENYSNDFIVERGRNKNKEVKNDKFEKNATTVVHDREKEEQTIENREQLFSLAKQLLGRESREVNLIDKQTKQNDKLASTYSKMINGYWQYSTTRPTREYSSSSAQLLSRPLSNEAPPLIEKFVLPNKSKAQINKTFETSEKQINYEAVPSHKNATELGLIRRHKRRRKRSPTIAAPSTAASSNIKQTSVLKITASPAIDDIGYNKQNGGKLNKRIRMIENAVGKDEHSLPQALSDNHEKKIFNNTASSDINSTKSTTTTNRQQQIQEQAYQRRRTLMELKQKYLTNRAINDKAYYILLIIYSLFIIIGTISNSLICLTVLLKPKILSPRNLFIFNLAGSDLLLCVFTMPFSFIEISMKMWQMGLVPCKLVAGLQATSIFVSTISITAIALDRYRVIVYPTHQETTNGTRSFVLILALVWFVGLSLSSPLFIFRTVEHWDLPLSYDTINSIDFCVEAWPLTHGRGIYSVISMIFQYVLPITIVSVVYAKISDKLQKRLIRRQKLTQLECQQKKQLNLIKRTHTMLISVSLIFGLSWLPLNLLNLIGDFTELFGGDDQLFRIVFAICHLIGCSSACSNPILYGYLNENFRKEFHQVYTHHAHQLIRLFRGLLSFVCGRRNIDMMTNYMPSSSSTIYSTSTSSSQSASSSNSSSASNDDDDDDDDDDEDDSSLINDENSSASSCRNDNNGDDVMPSKSHLCNNRHKKPSSSSSLMVTDYDKVERKGQANNELRSANTSSILIANNVSSLKKVDENSDCSLPTIKQNKCIEKVHPAKNQCDNSNNQSVIVVVVGSESEKQKPFSDNHEQSLSSINNNHNNNNKHNERRTPDQANRKFSFQTIASKQKLDKSMRFCLCISGLSSSDSLNQPVGCDTGFSPASIQKENLNTIQAVGSCSGLKDRREEQEQQDKLTRESGRKKRIKNRCDNKDVFESLEEQNNIGLELCPLENKLNKSTSQTILSNDNQQEERVKNDCIKRISTSNNNDDFKARKINKNKKKKKKKKGSNKKKNKTKSSSKHDGENCECQCHKQEQKAINSNCFANINKMNNTSSEVIGSNSNGRVLLNNVVNAITNKRKGSTISNANNEHQNQLQASGRRVWLRFFPAKEKYLNVSLDKTNASSLKIGQQQQTRTDNSKEQHENRAHRLAEERKHKKSKQSSGLRKQQQHCSNCCMNNSSLKKQHKRHQRIKQVAVDDCHDNEFVFINKKKDNEKTKKRSSNNNSSSCRQAKNLTSKITLVGATNSTTTSTNKSPKTTSFIQGLPMNVADYDDRETNNHAVNKSAGVGQHNYSGGVNTTKNNDNNKIKRKSIHGNNDASGGNKITGKYFLSVETARRKHSLELTSTSRERTSTSVLMLNGTELDSSSIVGDDLNNSNNNEIGENQLAYRQTTERTNCNEKLDIEKTSCDLECANKVLSQIEINNNDKAALLQTTTTNCNQGEESSAQTSGRHDKETSQEKEESNTVVEPSTPTLFSEVSQLQTTHCKQSPKKPTDDDLAETMRAKLMANNTATDCDAIEMKTKIITQATSSTNTFDKRKSSTSCCPFVNRKHNNAKLVNVHDYCSSIVPIGDCKPGIQTTDSASNNDSNQHNNTVLANNNGQDEMDECHSSSYVCLNSHTTSCSCSSITSSLACQLEDDMIDNVNTINGQQQQLPRLRSHTDSGSLAALAGSFWF